ncbi:microtubule-associated protein futsch [Bacillus rossius redtenbacheri]|uniref:microtubule-associated protein futsch n=1 Tax=Bacillus rossius redtenbacheri TaxID=93214 RepID=UPI002FDDB41B
MSEPQSEAGGGEAAAPVKPPPPSPLSGCYLLIVVGEPHSPEHKDIILQKIAKGFLSWDVQSAHVYLEKELEALTAQAPDGEEARNGERLIQYATENLVTEVLIHPQLNTLSQCIRNLLSSFTRHRHLIHAGYTFASSGSWILQDGTFSLADFVDAFQEAEVQRVLRAYDNCVTVDVHCSPEGDWTTERMLKESFSKSCKVRVNPTDRLTAGGPAIGNFLGYVAPFLTPASVEQLLEPSDVVGNIRFSHPTLYVFPGGQGDAALFGINGFNMLVDGGFNRKACFWDFARHLDRLDAVLMTRLNNDNVNGIAAVLRRKRQSTVYPQIGHFFSNLQERRHAASPDGDKDRDPLLVSLLDEGQEVVANLRQLQLRPHPCYRDGNQAEPINLYHKVGHGKLDMYVVSPARDSREVKEFLAKWNSNDMRLFLPGKKDKDGFHFPVQNLVSICALLVWQPANPSDTITRILFPGSCPQHKIFEGLDKIRHLEFLKHAVCSTKSISPSTSAVAMTARTGGKQKSTPAVIDKILPGESMVKTPPKPLDIGKQPVAKSATIPVSGVQQTKPSTPISTTTTPTTAKAPPQAKPKVEKPTSKTEPPKSKTETNKILEGDKHVSKVDKHAEKIAEKITKTVSETKSKEHKSKIDSKTSTAKSRIDSKPPRSLERRKERAVTEKKGDVKSSPTTPKRSVEHKVNGAATKTEVAKVSRAPSKGRPSPTSTPAKSAKEANNRKVVESKYHVARAASSSRAPVTKTVKKEQHDNVSVPQKPERKPMSRRPKPSSPSKSSKAPGSPAKSSSAKSTPTPSVKSDKDGVIRKPKTEIEKVTTDSSAVSTPSTAEPETVPFKAKLAHDEIIPSTIKHITDLTAASLETSSSDVNVETKLLENIDTTITTKEKELEKGSVLTTKEDETLKKELEFESLKASKDLEIFAQEETEEDEVTEDKESELIEGLEEKHLTQDTEITEEERTEDIEDEDEILTEPGKTLEDEMDMHGHEMAKDVQEIEDEEDEYLIIEKEEIEQMMEDSLQEEESTESHIPYQKEVEEDESELQKHLRDEVESEKEKKFEEQKETEKETVTYSDGNTEKFKTEKFKVTDEGKEEIKIAKVEPQILPVEEKHVQDVLDEKKEPDDMTKTDVTESIAIKAHVLSESEISKTEKITPETKEKIQEKVQEIITSAEEIATKTKIETDKFEDGVQDKVKLLDESIDEKKDSEELDDQKETSSISPEEKVDLSSEKLREMTEETRGADHKLDDDHDESLPLKGTVLRDATDQKYTAEESQPDEKFSTTVESGATTAPTLPEDERIPLDEIKEIVEEKYVKEETKEEKPATAPVASLDQPTTMPHVVVPSTIGVFEARAPQSQTHQRDIVKTPDEVADLPVHEEVDTGMYESEDDFPKVKDDDRGKKHVLTEATVPGNQEIIEKESKKNLQETIPEAKTEVFQKVTLKKDITGDQKLDGRLEKDTTVGGEIHIQKQDETQTKLDEDERDKTDQEKIALLAETKEVKLDTKEIKIERDDQKETKDKIMISGLTIGKDTLVTKDEEELNNLEIESKQEVTQDFVKEDKQKTGPLEEDHTTIRDLNISDKDQVCHGKEYVVTRPKEDEAITKLQSESLESATADHISEKETTLEKKVVTPECTKHDITSEVAFKDDEVSKYDKKPSESSGREFSSDVKPLLGKDEEGAMQDKAECSTLETQSLGAVKSITLHDPAKDEFIPADKDKIEKYDKQVDNKILEDMLQAQENLKEQSVLKDVSQLHEESQAEPSIQKEKMFSHAEEMETLVSDALQSQVETEGTKILKDTTEKESHVDKLDSFEIHKTIEHEAEEPTTTEKRDILQTETKEQDSTIVQSVVLKDLQTEDSIKQITGHFIDTERNVPDTSIIKQPGSSFATEASTTKLADSEKMETFEDRLQRDKPIIPDTDSEAKDKDTDSEAKDKLTENVLHYDSKVDKISLDTEKGPQEEKLLSQDKIKQDVDKTDTHESYKTGIVSEDKESKVHSEEKVELTKDKTEAKKTEIETAQMIEEQKTDSIETPKDDKLSIAEVHKEYDAMKHEKFEDLDKLKSKTEEITQQQLTDYEGKLPTATEKLQDVLKETTLQKDDIIDTKYEKTVSLHEKHLTEELETKEPEKKLVPDIGSAEKPVKTLPTEVDGAAIGEISATYLEIIDKLQQKLPSKDDAIDVSKDIANKKFAESSTDKLMDQKTAHTPDISDLKIKEDESVQEDIQICDKKQLPCTAGREKEILADGVQSLEQEPTKQIPKVDTNLEKAADLSIPHPIRSDEIITKKLPTGKIVSGKSSDSDDDDQEIIKADIKKVNSDQKDTVESKDEIASVTKDVDDDLGRDYEGDVEEDEEDDDYVGSEYVDSGLEEEPVYSKLAAAAVPEYVTVTPDSAPPSPGDLRIHERTRDVLITEKYETPSHIITDGTKVSLSEQASSEKQYNDFKDDVPPLVSEDKLEKIVGDKLQSSANYTEKAIKDTEFSVLSSTQDQIVSGTSTPLSSDSGQLLADTKSESGISTPHSMDSNKTHEMKGESDSYKHDYEKAPSPAPMVKQILDDYQKDEDESLPSISVSPETTKVMEECKLKKEKVASQPTETKQIDDQIKFLEHEIGEASILDDERDSDGIPQDVNQKFIVSEREISAKALKETDTTIYDISFHPVTSSKTATEIQITTPVKDESKETELTKLGEFKVDQLEALVKSSTSDESVTERTVSSKDKLTESSTSKEDTLHSSPEEKISSGNIVVEPDSHGRKPSDISESEVSYVTSVTSGTQETEIKSKDKYGDVLPTDTVDNTTVSQQSQQDISSSSTVRRMVVTATSEDGGAETEVCSTESLTGKSAQYSDKDESPQEPNEDSVKVELDSGLQKTVAKVIETSETNGHINLSDKEDFESYPDEEHTGEGKKTITTKTITTKIISHSDIGSAMLEKEHDLESLKDNDDNTITKVTKPTDVIISKVASDVEDSLMQKDEKFSMHKSLKEPDSPQIIQSMKEFESLSQKDGEDHKAVSYDSQESVSHEILPGSPKITTKTTTTTTVIKKILGDDSTLTDEPSSHYGSQESVAYEAVPGSPKITTKTTTTTTVIKRSLGDDAMSVDKPPSHYGSQESISHDDASGSPQITRKTTTTVLKKSLGDEISADESSSHHGSQEYVSYEIIPGSPKTTTKITTTTTVLKKSLGDDILADESSSHYGSQESVSHEITPGSPKTTTKTTTTTTILKKSLGDDILAGESSSHYGSLESVSPEITPGSPKTSTKTITTTTVLKKSLGDDILADESSNHYGSHESVSHEITPGSPKTTTKTITTTTVLKKSLGDDILADESSSHYGSQESVSHEITPGSPKTTTKTTTTTLLKKSLEDDILADESSSHYGSQESVSHGIIPGSPKTTTKTTTTTTTVLKKPVEDDIGQADEPSSKTVTTTVTTVTKKIVGDEEETTTTTKEIDSDGERTITKTVEKDGKVTEHFSTVKKVGDDDSGFDIYDPSHVSSLKTTDKSIESADPISAITGKVEKYSEKVVDLAPAQSSLDDKLTKECEEKTIVTESDGVRSTTVITMTKSLAKELGDVEFPTILNSGVSIIKREATETVRSGTPGSDTFSDRDIEYCGPSTPHSDISSGQVSRAPTHIWGESSEGHPDSEDDEDQPGSPLSTSSQLGHSPPPHFEDVMSDKHQSSPMVMTGSFYGTLPDDPLQQLSQEKSLKKVSDPIPISVVASGKTGDITMKTELASSFKHYSPQDKALSDDFDFEKALHEHRIARGEDFAPKTSTVTYGFESKSSPSHTSKVEKHQSSDVNGQKHNGDDNDSDGSHEKYNGKPSVESTSITTYHISTEPSSSVKKVTTTSTTVTSSGEHDPMFRHQIGSSVSSSSSTFPEPPQGFGLPPSSKPGDIKDPIEGWGKPLGLPAPIPPPTNDTETSTEIVATSPSNKGTPKKEKKSLQTKKTMLMNENNKIKDGSNKKRPESPIKQGDRKGSSTNKDTSLRSAKAAGSPIYVDLTYVPHHGNSYYSSVEFFKKVRARYYVFSGTDPSRDVYNALLEAKQTWDDKELEVTIIPTYDTDTLGYWVAENEDLLTKCKIDLSPSASRCTINLQDHETSCSAYRLEF